MQQSESEQEHLPNLSSTRSYLVFTATFNAANFSNCAV